MTIFRANEFTASRSWEAINIANIDGVRSGAHGPPQRRDQRSLSLNEQVVPDQAILP